MTKKQKKKYTETNDQQYFVRKCSELARKIDIEKVRHQIHGKSATDTVKKLS